MKIDYFTMPGGISIRYGIWDCKAENKKGSVILLGGRKEFMEKYAETIEELKHRRFDVYGMDWRGQGLSSRLLPNRHKGHIENFGEYLEDLEYFINKIVKPAAVSPIVILAHSMGGHLTLRFLHDFPAIADRAVLTSPMIDISAPNYPRWFIKSFATMASVSGFRNVYSAGSGNYSAVRIRFEGNPLTSDPARFMDEHKAISDDPDLAIGGVTYGWLKAAFDSIGILRKAGYAGRIKTPVLIVGAGRDRIVSGSAQRDICAVMEKGRFVVIPDSLHEILKEKDSIRNAFWKEFDTFSTIH